MPMSTTHVLSRLGWFPTAIHFHVSIYLILAQISFLYFLKGKIYLEDRGIKTQNPGEQGDKYQL